MGGSTGRPWRYLQCILIPPILTPSWEKSTSFRLLSLYFLPSPTNFFLSCVGKESSVALPRYFPPPPHGERESGGGGKTSQSQTADSASPLPPPPLLPPNATRNGWVGWKEDYWRRRTRGGRGSPSGLHSVLGRLSWLPPPLLTFIGDGGYFFFLGGGRGTVGEKGEARGCALRGW